VAALFLAAGVMPAMAEDMQLPVAEDDAVQTVEAYLGALISANVDDLRSYLAPAMAERYTALLDNPDYGNTLLQEYAGASVEIVDGRQLNPDDAQVDARILLATGDVVGVRFLLSREESRGYLIVSEN
jgi:hypothetical protein